MPDDGKKKKSRRTAALWTRPNDFAAALKNQGRRFSLSGAGSVAHGGSRHADISCFSKA
jgi:hypothetical protein